MKSPTKPMRLFRPQPSSFFPSPDVVAMYDEEKQIIHYDKELFEQLSPEEKHRIYTLNEPVLVATTDNVFSI